MTVRALFATVLAAAACLVGSGAAASAPGYRVIAIERLTSGAPAATPDLGLLARIDDGSGGAAAYATGELTWTLDRRQLGVAAVDSIVAAPAGTQFGWVTSGPTGGTAVQLPLRKIGASVGDGETVIEAAAEIPKEFAAVVGATAPVTFRVRAQQLVVTLNVHAAVGRFRASGIGDVVFDLVGIYLFGTYSSAGTMQHLATNPTKPTELALGVSARPCADVSCARLGTPVTDTLSFSLPKAATVRAPQQAFYGRKTVFSGTTAPGDKVHLAFVRAPGAEPVCSPTSVAALPACFPPYAAVYDRLVETTTTGPDGQWALPVVLRTVFVNGPLGKAHPATGRYAAVVYAGDVLSDPSFNGGRFSVFAAADVETVVALAKPRLTIQLRGRRVNVTVAVPGGDPFVSVRLDRGGVTVADGHLDARGTFRATLVGTGGVLRATASVDGARSSTARMVLQRGLGRGHR